MRYGEQYIEVIAPSSGSSKEEVENSLKYLSRFDLGVRVRGRLHRKNHYTSDVVERRLQHLVEAIKAKDSQIIWCMRGGYGSIDLLPYLDKLRGKFPQKVFIGLSDISILHCFLQQKWGWSTIHGPTLKRLGNEEVSKREQEWVEKIIKEHDVHFQYKLKAFNTAAKKIKKIKSKICGGNLYTLTSLSGSPWQLNTKKKILFLEDINERGYQIDRSLKNLELSGTLQACKAVILGDFVGGEEKDGKSFVKQSLQDFFAGKKYPVFYGLKSGHGEMQLPIAFNSESVIDENLELSVNFTRG